MLTERQEIILTFIVDDFLNVMTPISSKYLLDKYKFDVSSATIRNEMAVLEKEGFLIKTHTSSGRVPSRKALKFYIEELKLNIEQSPAKSFELYSGTDNLENLTDELALAISDRTGYLTQVSLAADNETVKGLYITPLTNTASIAIIVLNSGAVRQMPVKTNRDVTIDDFQKLSNIFNELLLDKNLGDTRVILKNNAHVPPGIRDLYDQVTAQIMASVEVQKRTIGHAGFNYLLQDMRNEVETLEHLYGDIESEALYNSVEQLTSNDVSIYFGDELDESYKSLSVITTNFEHAGLSGNLIVVGPELMGYKNVIKLLHSFKKGV